MKTTFFYIIKSILVFIIFSIIIASWYFLYNYTKIATIQEKEVESLFTLESKWELLKNCKIMKKENKHLDTYSIKCWSFYNKVHFIKLTWIDFPKENQCWYKEVKEYLQARLNKKILRFKILWNYENFEYWYLYHWNENLNNTLISEGLVNYKEDWLLNKQFLETWNIAKQLKDWYYKKCIQNKKNK